MKKLVFFMCFVALVFYSSANAELWQEYSDRIGKTLVDDGHVVGCMVAIVDADTTLSTGYGTIKEGQQLIPDEATIFEIGSVSKVFTGILFADAVQRKVVGLNSLVNDLLPAASGLKLKGQDVALSHLATHTSGLLRLPVNFKILDASDPYIHYNLEKLWDGVKGYRPPRKPGAYLYSNWGMGLLGALISKAQSKTYAELLSTRITKPLELHDTAIHLSKSQQSRLAQGYAGLGQPAKPWDLASLAGAGGVRSTMSDMIRFMQAHFKKSPLHSTLNAALNEQVKLPNGQRMGLGWHIARDGMTRWHNGMTGGYASYMAMVPQRQLGVIVLANTASDEVTVVGEQLLVAAFSGKAPQQKAVKLSVDELSAYVGRYELAPAVEFTITRKGQQLHAQLSGQSSYPVYVEGEDLFVYKVVEAKLSFQRNKKGKVIQLILHQGGINQTATKLK